MGGVFTIINELSVPEEARAAFEEKFGANLKAHLGNTPGLKRATLLQPTRPDRPYLAMMEFVDADAFRAFRGSDAFAAAHPGTERGFARQKVLGTYETAAEVVTTA